MSVAFVRIWRAGAILQEERNTQALDAHPQPTSQLLAHVIVTSISNSKLKRVSRFSPSEELSPLSSGYLASLEPKKEKSQWVTIKVKAPVVVKAIQVRAVSQAKAVRAEDKTILPARAVKVLPARATRVRETPARANRGPRVRATQAKAVREMATTGRI
jgi:hypothetical protein